MGKKTGLLDYWGGGGGGGGALATMSCKWNQFLM